MRVVELEALLVDPELRDEAMELIRSIIQTIALAPDADAAGEWRRWCAGIFRGW